MSNAMHDPSLIDKILANRRFQEYLAEKDPLHPLRAIGEFAEARATSEVAKLEQDSWLVKAHADKADLKQQEARPRPKLEAQAPSSSQLGSRSPLGQGSALSWAVRPAATRLARCARLSVGAGAPAARCAAVVGSCRSSTRRTKSHWSVVYTKRAPPPALRLVRKAQRRGMAT
jgi:hypothetical protein